MSQVHAERLEHLLRGAIAALKVESPVSFSWFGRREVAVAPWLRPRLTKRERDAALQRSVAWRLYGAFYCRGLATPDPPATPSPLRDADWIAQLSRANSSGKCRDSGWLRIGTRGERVIVRKNGIRLSAAASDLRRESDATVSIAFPNELLRASPGFYVASSEAPFRSGLLFRIYWNIRHAGAAALVREGTTRLNRAGLPFRLKAAAHPDGFERCDGAVLYAERRDRDAVFDVLASLAPLLAPHLRPDVPVFAKRIAPGVGIGEEPGTGESFGYSRCMLLAKAMVRSAASPARREDRFRLVRAAFAREGIPLERSFLNPGSTDVYPLLIT